MDEQHLKTFETRVRLRPTTIDDFDALVALQLRCFPGMKPWTHEQIVSQLTVFPEGQFVIEIDGRIVGSASSLIVDSSGHSEWHNWSAITDSGFIRSHDPGGDTV